MVDPSMWTLNPISRVIFGLAAWGVAGELLALNPFELASLCRGRRKSVVFQGWLDEGTFSC